MESTFSNMEGSEFWMGFVSLPPDATSTEPMLGVAIRRRQNAELVMTCTAEQNDREWLGANMAALKFSSK